jgi:para-nitrobenzyl esterase
MEAIVKTTGGLVRGVALDDGITVYRGIPFAAPPTGDLRFRLPQPAAPWDGTRDASRFGDVVPQSQAPGIFNQLFGPTHAMGPDCLNLNVWTPDPGAGALPVLVWIHGGAFVIGSGSDSIYDGRPFARDGVVTVTINYRLGAAGFHHAGASVPGRGAFGIADQIAALEWVQENIASFGGDPGRVTIAGESAGGMSVGTLLGAPRAQGLFRRAIPQSGAAHHGLPEAAAARIAEHLAERLGIDPTDVAAWAGVPDERLLEAQQTLNDDVTSTRDVERFGEAAASSMPWQPMYGGDVLPQRPIDAIRAGSANNVDVLIGTCREEFMLFFGIAPELLGLDESMVAPMFDIVFGAAGRSGADALEAYRRQRPDASAVELFSALETDRMFRIPSVRLAEAQVANGARTFAYLFSWRSPAFDGRIQAGHALELPFTWDNIADPLAHKLVGDDPPQALADDMHAAWVRFITDGGPGWPAYDLAHRTTRDFGGEAPLVDDPMGVERKLWDGVL